MKRTSACLIVAALATVGCGGGHTTAGSQTSASSAAPKGSTSPLPSGSRKTRSNGSSPAPSTSTAALPSAAPAAGPVPATGTPPKLGTYVYDVTFNGKQSTRRTTIAADGTSSAGTKLAERASSGSATATQHVIWTKDAKSLAETDSSQGSNRFDCDWNPDMIEYKFPLAKGAHWSQSTSCTVTYGGAKITSKVHNDATVRDSGQVTVAGTTVKVWIIDTTITNTSSDGTHTSSGSVKRTTQFAPEIGLPVRYTEVGKTPSGTASATFVLKNTKPS